MQSLPSNDTQSVAGKKQYSPVATFWGLSSFQMLAMFRRGLFYTFLSIYMREFLQLSVTATTLYATIPMFLSSFCQMFVWGRISDKLQKRRTLIIIGEFIAGTLLVITYWIHKRVAVNSYQAAGYVIIAGLSVIEIFWSMSNISWSALISDLYPSRDRSRVMSQLTGIGGLGRIVGILLGGVLYEGLFQFQYEGWGFFEGPLFYLSSLAMFLSTIPLFFIPEGGIASRATIKASRKTRKISETLETNPEEEPVVDDAHFQRYLKVFIVFLIALIFINFGRNSVAVIFSQYIRLEGLFPVKIDSRLLSYIANMRSFATIAVGIFAARIIKRIGNSLSLIIAGIFAILYLFLTLISNSLVLVFFAGFFSGASEVIIGAASYAYAAELIPEERRGKLFGIYNATFFLSWGLASTLITGPLVDFLLSIEKSEIFSYQMAFVAAIVITAIGLSIFIGLDLYRKAKFETVLTSEVVTNEERMDSSLHMPGLDPKEEKTRDKE